MSTEQPGNGWTHGDAKMVLAALERYERHFEKIFDWQSGLNKKFTALETRFSAIMEEGCIYGRDTRDKVNRIEIKSGFMAIIGGAVGTMAGWWLKIKGIF